MSKYNFKIYCNNGYILEASGDVVREDVKEHKLFIYDDDEDVSITVYLDKVVAIRKEESKNVTFKVTN